MSVKKVPLRQCIGCGEMKEKKNMIRIVKDGENPIFLDTTGKKNGRGAYLCKSTSCLEAAVKKRGIERSLKTSVSSQLYESLKKELEEMDE